MVSCIPEEKERPSILADVFESTTAAIYLDSGDLEQAKKFILTFLAPAAKAQNVKPFKDYKPPFRRSSSRTRRKSSTMW